VAESEDGELSFDEAVSGLTLGDENAFRIVYRTMHPVLLRYVTALVGISDAEDIASETWAQAFRDLGRFAGTGDGFRGWLATIARNRALDHVRAQRRRPQSATEEIPQRSTDLDASDAAIESISTAEALRLIAELPIDQAEAVLLRAVMGLDAKSAGKVLGKRPGAVRTAAHRGLRQLAVRLNDASARDRTDESPVVSGRSNTFGGRDADKLI
jgi:RNA polymerase sigma-70 factor (ECF subfamily)